MKRAAPLSPFVQPLATKSTISRSRAVSAEVASLSLDATVLLPLNACANNSEQIADSSSVRLRHCLEPSLELLERDDVG